MKRDTASAHKSNLIHLKYQASEGFGADLADLEGGTRGQAFRGSLIVAQRIDQPADVHSTPPADASDFAKLNDD